MYRPILLDHRLDMGTVREKAVLLQKYSPDLLWGNRVRPYTGIGN
jgi:hypothetical protein